MESLARFYTEYEAMQFCDSNPKKNLFITKELDGMFHVYDMEGGER
jgi:hypothetical protein